MSEALSRIPKKLSAKEIDGIAGSVFNRLVKDGYEDRDIISMCTQLIAKVTKRMALQKKLEEDAE